VELALYISNVKLLEVNAIKLKVAAEYAAQGIAQSLQANEIPDIYLSGTFDDMYIILDCDKKE